MQKLIISTIVRNLNRFSLSVREKGAKYLQFKSKIRRIKQKTELGCDYIYEVENTKKKVGFIGSYDVIIYS